MAPRKCTTSTTRKSVPARPSRISFAYDTEGEKTPGPARGRNNFDEEMEEIEQDEDDTHNDLRSVFEEIQKRQAKKSSARSTQFQTQRKALYTQARQNARTMVQEGLARFEECRRVLAELKKNEVTMEQQAGEIFTLFPAHEESSKALLEQFPALFEDLCHRRTEKINDACAFVRNEPATRKKQLDYSLVKFREQVERTKTEAQVAADAAQLIKHYDRLLKS